MLDLSISPVRYIDQKGVYRSVGKVSIQGGVEYLLNSKEIRSSNLLCKIGNLFDLKINSTVYLSSPPVINTNLNSSFVNVSNTMQFVNALSKREEKSNNQIEKSTSAKKNNKQKEELKITLNLNYFANLITYDSYKFYRYYLNSRLRNSHLEFSTGFKKFMDGFVEIKGKMDLQDTISITSTLDVKNLNMKRLTTTYMGKKLIEGSLSSNMKIRTNNRYADKDFMKNLFATGTTTIEKGVLHDKADILYPVRFLNKIIPTKNKMDANISRFKTIDIHFLIKNERLKIKNFNMKGLVFNADGSLDLGLNHP